MKPKQIDGDGNRRYIIITHSLIVLSYAFVTNIFFNSAGSNDATGETTVWYDRKFRLKNTPTSTRGAAGFSDFVVQTVYGLSLNPLSSDPSISTTGKKRSVPLFGSGFIHTPNLEKHKFRKGTLHRIINYKIINFRSSSTGSKVRATSYSSINSTMARKYVTIS